MNYFGPIARTTMRCIGRCLHVRDLKRFRFLLSESCQRDTETANCIGKRARVQQSETCSDEFVKAIECDDEDFIKMICDL